MPELTDWEIELLKAATVEYQFSARIKEAAARGEVSDRQGGLRRLHRIGALEKTLDGSFIQYRLTPLGQSLSIK